MQRDCKGSAEILTRSTVLAVLLAAAISAWVAAGFHPFTWPMRIAVAVPVLVAVGFQWRQPGPNPVAEPAPTPSYRRCVMAWTGLLVLATAWELTALFSSPRDDHPTLSSIGDDVMRTHPGRAVTFALWLVLGWLLFVRPQVERRR
jgi:hypothetical protein